MSTAAIVWIAMMAAACGLSLALHGKPQKDVSFTGTLINTGIHSFILYSGGFFS